MFSSDKKTIKSSSGYFYLIQLLTWNKQQQMSLMESDLKFYYLVDSDEAFDEEEMNEVS